MTEFALLNDGALREISQHHEEPADIPYKSSSWHPAVRDEGPADFTGIKNGNWLMRKALPTLKECRAQEIADLIGLR